MRTDFGFVVKQLLDKFGAGAADVKENCYDMRFEIRLALAEQPQNHVFKFDVV